MGDAFRSSPTPWNVEIKGTLYSDHCRIQFCRSEAGDARWRLLIDLDTHLHTITAIRLSLLFIRTWTLVQYNLLQTRVNSSWDSILSLVLFHHRHLRKLIDRAFWERLISTDS